MTQPREMNGNELEALLREAKEARAPASIRAVGSPRMLGDLQVRGLEPGRAIHLMGAKRRDQFPPSGTDVMLSLLVGDEVISAHTMLLDPIVSNEGDTLFPPILRVAWPTQAIETHRRHDVRVATPDLPPLKAILEVEGRRIEAHLLNLTETGMGIGLAERLSLGLRAQVEVEAELPGGAIIRSTGEVRHAEMVESEPLPMRLGLVLGCMTDQTRESLRRFIQARRTDRSEELRKAH